MDCILIRECVQIRNKNGKCLMVEVGSEFLLLTVRGIKNDKEMCSKLIPEFRISEDVSQIGNDPNVGFPEH